MPWVGMCNATVGVCNATTQTCDATTQTCTAAGQTCRPTGRCGGCRCRWRGGEGAMLCCGQGPLFSPRSPQGSSPLPSRCVSLRCRHVQPATWASCVSEGSRERAGGCDKAPACGGVSTALLRGPSSCRSRFHFLPVPACAAQLHAVQQLPRSILFRDERCFRSGRKL